MVILEHLFGLFSLYFNDLCLEITFQVGMSSTVTTALERIIDCASRWNWTAIIGKITPLNNCCSPVLQQ